MNSLTTLLVFSWLWPFGGGDVDDEDATIKALERTEVVIDSEQSIDNASELARQNYQLFLDLVGDDANLGPEAMRRLADLELEASEAETLSDNLQNVMLTSYDGAVDLYEQLLERYPNYERNDLVLYQLARAYESSGEIDAALATLERLVAEYPETIHRSEAEFRRGEMLFINRRYADAEDAYRFLTDADTPGGFYLQSLYKLGWSQFKIAAHDDSLDPFFRLLDLRLIDSDPLGGLLFTENTRRAERELIQDTLRVLSITFSYMDGPESIDAFLDAEGERQYAHVIYKNLGDLYVQKERYEDATKSYQAFVARNPVHPRSPLLELDVIEAFKLAGFPTRVLDAKETFVEHYGMDTPFWTTNDAAALPEVVGALKVNLTDLAQFYHARAQNPEAIVADIDEAEKALRRDQQIQEDYTAAARWYRKYLNYFPGQADSAGTNFLLAEILFESGSFNEATDEYERTAYDYPTHPRAAEAGYAALLSYRQHEKTLPTEAVANWHERSLSSALRFAGSFPEHPETAAVLTSTAEDFFSQGRFEQAIDVADDVTAMLVEPKPELTLAAWTVVAHSNFDLARFSDAEQAYYQLQARLPLDDQTRQEEVRERIAASIYKQGELARDSGDLETAVGHFLRVAQAVPNSPVRETAEYDAAAALISMGQWARATPVLEAFRQNYPNSSLAEDVSRSLATGYLETGDSMRAAGEFERIADDEVMSVAEREEALWTAAELYQTAGMRPEERSALERVVARYPASFDQTLEARMRLADIAQLDADIGGRMRWLEDIVAVDAAAGAARTDRSRYLAATATLELTEPKRLSFVALKLTAPLKASLERKRELMEQTLAAYGKAADYGVAEVTTASTFRIGQMYQQFSRDLMDSERPADLDADALEQYDILLEEQAFPFEEQAIEVFEANAARAADGVFDVWVEQSFDALATLMPARYAKAERSGESLALFN
ncbi:MAG: tetratricopeptide repeat protein [Pseudomonadota bacterium]